jgi:hypothetical protein
MSHATYTFDIEEVLVRGFKYVFEGLVVAVAAFFIPGNHKLGGWEILLLGLIAAATFSVLDLFAPSIGASARSGAGFGIGASVVGGIPTHAAGRVM